MGTYEIDSWLNHQITRHFHASEFRCRCDASCCNARPIEHELVRRLQILRDRLRLASGVEIRMIVNSGSRCEFWNAQVDGKANSFHLRGMAADIQVRDDYTRYLMVRYGAELFSGIGVGDDFVHFDIRPAKPVMWTY